MSIKRLVPLNTVSLTVDPSNAVAGDIYYNSGSSQLRYFNGTSWVILAGSVNALVDAKSIYQDVRNQSGTNMALATPVYVSGGIGASNKILISTASNASEASSSKTMGITTSAISNNSNGQVISEGLLEGIDTTGAADGDPVWLGVDGAKIYGLANKPAAPAHLVFLGIVIRGGSSNTGSMYVKIQNGFELQEIHDVQLSSLINGNILAYDSTTSTWKNTNTLQSTASTVPLVIKGSASQTANLQQWQDSAGTVLGYFDVNGTLKTNYIQTGLLRSSSSNQANLYTGADSGSIRIDTGLASGKGLIVRGAASQTANLLEWQNSGGTLLGRVDNGGGVQSNYLYAGTYSYYNSQLNVTSIAASNIGAVVRGAASQTANLQEWQNNSGTILNSISASGTLNINTSGTGTINLGDGVLAKGPGNGFTFNSDIIVLDGKGIEASSGKFTNVTGISTVPLIAKAISGQTANMQEWQNSSGTITARVGNGGQIVSSGVGVFGSQSNTSNAQLAVIANSLVYPTFVAKAIASQTANLTEWQNSSAAVLAKVDANGKILVYGDDLGNFQSVGSTTTLYNGFTATNNNNLGSYTLGTAGSAETTFNVPNAFYIYDRINGAMRFKIMSTGLVGINSYTPAAQLQVNASSASTVALIAKATTSQTADIQQWQISDGTVRMRVTGDGTFGTSGNIYANRYYYSSNGTASGTSISFLDGSNGGGLSIRNIDLGTPNSAFDGIVPLSISGNLNQTADLQHWKNSVGTVLSGINPAGQIYAGTTTSINGSITGEITSATKVSSTVATFGYTGTSLVKVGQRVTISSPSGYYDGTGFNGTWTVTAVTSNTFTVLGSGFVGWIVFPEFEDGIFTLSAAGSFVANTALTTPVAVRGVASQTANLQEWQNASGTVLAKIDASGNATAASFVKTSGTSSQFLKADGSVDSSTYLTTGTASSTYLPLTGGTVSSDLTVTGNFTVNGTTTNLNSTNLVVEDKNIIVADVTTPTDTTADGAGITIKGATDKTLNWVQSTGSFTSSEPLIVSSNAANNITVFTAKDANNNKVIVNSDASNRTFITAQSNSSATGQAGAYFTADGFEESWFNINTRSNTAGQKYMRFGNLGNKFLVQRLNDAASSITSTPFTIENTSTTNSLYINSTGTIINGATALGQLTVYSASASTIGMVIRGAASQTADLQQWQDSTGAVLAEIMSNGSLFINSTGTSNDPITIQRASATRFKVDPYGNVFAGALTAGNVVTSIAGTTAGIYPSSASTNGLIIRGAASQTADLQQWQNSAGTTLLSVSPDGYLNKTGTVYIGPNLTFADPGVGNETKFVFTKSSDGAYLTVKERSADQTFYEFGMYDNALDGGDYFQWANGQWSGPGYGWMPLQLGNNSGKSQTLRFVGEQSIFWSPISTPVNSPYFTYLPVNIASTDYEVNKWAPDNGSGTNIRRLESSGSTATFNIDISGYTYAARMGYRVTIDAGATTFSYTTYGGDSSSGSAIAINAGNWVTLSNGLKIKIGAGALAGENWSFLAFPTPRVGIGGATDTSALGIIRPAATDKGLIIKGAVSQTANLQEWQDSAGTSLSSVDSTGRFVSTIGLYTNAKVSIGGASWSGGAANLNVWTTATTSVGTIIRGTASQTANLQEWQNSAGTILSSIAPNGATTIDVASAASTSTQLFLSNSGTGANTAAKIQFRLGGAAHGSISSVYLATPSVGSALLFSTNDSVGTEIERARIDNSGTFNISGFGSAAKGLVVKAAASQTANLQEWQNNSATVLAKVDANGNFSAISKSFDIPHPTKENMRLRYASLEGNEHGVYVRGTTKENVIELPEYWTKLVDESTITVSLTSIGKFQKVYVEKIEGNKIYIGGRVKEISYAVFGERKDIDKLIVEY